jgi:predicted tellurium resistance membrane protein TerC
MFIRIALLWSITWVMRLTTPWFVTFGNEISGRDMILLVGGLFLIAKSTHEIHDKLEGEEGHGSAKAAASFVGIIIQILLLDIVFSLDSVITAVGYGRRSRGHGAGSDHRRWRDAPLGRSHQRFRRPPPDGEDAGVELLLLIGVSLIGEGLDQHIPKGYIYFAMGFSIFVEMINLRVRARAKPVHLHQSYTK